MYVYGSLNWKPDRFILVQPTKTIRVQAQSKMGQPTDKLLLLSLHVYFVEIFNSEKSEYTHRLSTVVRVCPEKIWRETLPGSVLLCENADFAQVVIDKGNTTGFTPSPIWGLRHCHLSVSHGWHRKFISSPSLQILTLMSQELAYAISMHCDCSVKW